ncbi:MAG: CBS domain-containing protein [Deltaproteobacteria bacterium]|nr:MAG: CBS domain-containing protein [Deltaproteobacteria bacterium]
MKTVRQLLGEKGHTVYTIAPGATVFEALERMADCNVGALVVIDDGEVVGLISEREYARGVILKGRFSKDTPVREIMKHQVVCVGSRQKVDGCMALMTDNRVRHLPVLENGQLAGIISIGDVVKAIIEDQQFTIEQLEHYIRGSG